MRTVQMTLDEELIAQVDRLVKRKRTTRSAFTREALRAALRSIREEELERRHKDGYKRRPVKRGEFDAWHSQQVWPE